jgi:hypothetical protein
MARGSALSYPIQGVSVASLPNTVVYRGVLMLIPLTVYLTRYHGKLSRRYLVSWREQDGSINRLKYKRSNPRSSLTIGFASVLNASDELSESGTGAIAIG